MVPTVPSPRRPLDTGHSSDFGHPSHAVRHWYENELGWPTVPGTPVDLPTGLRFDVLDAPVEAGYAALRHLVPGSPVAVRADRMRILVAAGSADELPGLLDWLEWGLSRWTSGRSARAGASRHRCRPAHSRPALRDLQGPPYMSLPLPLSLWICR